MGVYKYDATNDELIPIAGAPSAQGLEDKVSTYTADATYWDTSPTAASTKPVISDGIKTQFDLVHNELSDVNNILGSKNILPNSATTQVINGITYTVAADGSINVNGTASADSILHIIPGTIGKLSAIFSKGGNYIISAGTTGSGVDFFFGLEYTGSTWDIGEWLKYSTQLSKEIYIDGTKLNNSSSYIESYIKVNSGTTVSNIKVYPMLRPSSVRDDTYVPYSKTNYELTTEISNLANSFNWNTIDLTSSPTDYYTNAILKTAKDVVVRNRYGSQIVLTPFGNTIWTHFGNPANNYVDANYIFEPTYGRIRVTVNTSYGWDAQYAHINAIKYR